MTVHFCIVYLVYQMSHWPFELTIRRIRKKNVKKKKKEKRKK